MNSLKGILCIAIACVTIACAPKQSYTLVWEDDFNAPTLDTAYWNMDDNARGGGNAEMQYYTPRNVTIERHPVSGDRIRHRLYCPTANGNCLHSTCVVYRVIP